MKARKWLAIAVSLGMLAMAGCSDKDPVSSTPGPMDDATAAAKLVVTKNKVAGECNVPGCRPGFGKGGSVAPRPRPTPAPETPASTPQTLTATLPGGATMEFVWIEPGTFMMGAPTSEGGRAETEDLPHQVTISKGFYLGKFEITQEQWTAVMGTTLWSGQSLVQEAAGNPAVYISWDDMQAFVAKLNVAAGNSLYRLPTAAEWEYACRAGTTTRWSFGDDEGQLKDYAWYGYEVNMNVEEGYAHAVGTKKPNPWGLYDMHGNVKEWVQDWYHYVDPRFVVPEEPSTDPQGPSAGTVRGVRGGDFFHEAMFTRSARFDGGEPDLRASVIGARLVRVK